MKKGYSLIVLFFMTCLLCAAGAAGEADEIGLGKTNYRIYSTTDNMIVSITDIVDAFNDHDVLIFGEEHNDSVGHYLELLLLKKLFERYGDKLVLSLEMFDRDVQVVLDEYLEGKIETRYFERDARIWSNYKDYRAMVEFAKEGSIPLIAANSPFRYIHLANARGQQFLETLSEAARTFIAPLPYDTIEGVYRQKLIDLMAEIPEKRKEEMASDAGEGMKKMPKMPLVNIIQGQSLWNATMAYSIAEYLTTHPGKKVMQVNGRMHSDEHFGVCEQLSAYMPGITHLLVTAFPDSSFPEADFSRFTHLADYVIITDPEVAVTFEQ